MQHENDNLLGALHALKEELDSLVEVCAVTMQLVRNAAGPLSEQPRQARLICYTLRKNVATMMSALIAVASELEAALPPDSPKILAWLGEELADNIDVGERSP